MIFHLILKAFSLIIKHTSKTNMLLFSFLYCLIDVILAKKSSVFERLGAGSSDSDSSSPQAKVIVTGLGKLASSATASDVSDNTTLVYILSNFQ